jgi:hypothetical protein
MSNNSEENINISDKWWRCRDIFNISNYNNTVTVNAKFNLKTVFYRFKCEECNARNRFGMQLTAIEKSAIIYFWNSPYISIKMLSRY